MTPDIPMLEKVLAQIEAVAVEPFFDHETQRWLTWDQNQWRSNGLLTTEAKVHDAAIVPVEESRGCGTAMCFAGWTAELDPDAHWGNNEEYVVVTEDDEDDCHVETWARHRLGLTDHQASLLFDGENDLPALRDYIERLKEGDDLGEPELGDLEPEPLAPTLGWAIHVGDSRICFSDHVVVTDFTPSPYVSDITERTTE